VVAGTAVDYYRSYDLDAALSHLSLPSAVCEIFGNVGINSCHNIIAEAHEAVLEACF
jgi:hypothetical protein